MFAVILALVGVALFLLLWEPTPDCDDECERCRR